MLKYNLKVLPRSGIEQPYLIVPPKFSEVCREFEPTAVINTSLAQKLEAEEIENGTLTNLNQKIVYDCMDTSPYYEYVKEPYINELEAVDLGPIEDSNSETP